MGNWRTVQIIGTCSEQDLPALRKATEKEENWDNFHCFTRSASICGLSVDWPREKMSETGNLAERDYTVNDVADKLRELVGVAPSLQLKVHCGGEYEDGSCVATITVGSGDVSIGKPEVPVVVISEAQVMGSMMKLMGHS